MEHKTFDLAEVKADADSGTFTALASVFNNVDHGGDRMLPGSFTKTLEKWRESGKAIPIILSHQWDNLTAWVGKADPRAVYETDDGLVVQGSLFMDDDNAKKVHRLMKEGLLTGWSFGYSVPDGGQKRAKDGANNISEVELYEVGPTLVGMNSEAQLQTVKNLGVDPKVESNAEPAQAIAEVEDGPDEEPTEVKSRPQDPLRDQMDRIWLEAMSGQKHPLGGNPSDQ